MTRTRIPSRDEPTLSEAAAPIERLPAHPRFATLADVDAARIEIRWRDAGGAPHSLTSRLDAGRTSASTAGIEVSVEVVRAGGATTWSATISNRSGDSVFLEVAMFTIPTGIAPAANVRFFKHGYQSWSPSYSTDLAHTVARPSRIARLNHQSEIARPPEAPEAATSELFTVIEETGGSEALLIGFIGAASQLTTLTMRSPAEVLARALFDGVTLDPGESRAVEPLAAIRGGGAAQLAARWAAMVGEAMGARTAAKYQRGWCSWYHYFHTISEETLRKNLALLAAMRDQIPLEVVQLDDGFQSALGDWDICNAKFPGGLARLADEIRAAGFQAGIWTAPFLAARDSGLMAAHPGWFIRHQNGEPLRAAWNPNWTTDPGGYAYALDASNPAFADYLARLFRRLTAEFGYTYLKLDFLYAAAAEGRRHDLRLTRAETLRRGLEAIRQGAGERAFILGCGCPLGPAVGIVDGMRIGPDVAPAWNGSAGVPGAPSTAQALEAIVARSFMHRRLWLNDPDCLMLRARETALGAEERGALAAAIAATGGMLLISDDVGLLDSAACERFRRVAGIGEEVDSASSSEPALASDLMNGGAIRRVIKRLPDGALVMVLNLGDSVASLALESLGLPGGVFALEESRGDSSISPMDLPPHAARLLRWRPAGD